MTKENNVKKIMITVNGKPVGNGLLIDKVTYAPVNRRPTPIPAEMFRAKRLSTNPALP